MTSATAQLSFRHVVVLGGSTVYGQGDPKGGGFTGKLRAWHESAAPDVHRVFNLGIPGDGLEQMLQKGPQETAARHPDLILLYPALNDTRRFGSPDAPCHVPLESSELTLRALAKALMGIAPLAMMSSVPPDESRTCPFRDKWYFRMDDAERMTSVVAGVAREMGAGYLPLFERWRSRPDMQELLSDGLHCNEDGHQALFEEVRDFVIDFGREN